MIQSTLAETTFSQFQQLLVERAGLLFTRDRAYLLEDRLRERISASGLHSYEEYLNLLLFHPDAKTELGKLLDILTVGETSFFRNEPQFEVLQNFVIPKLAEKKRSGGRPSIRIWSAGCSTGEEPYTLAMVLHEASQAAGGWDISIVATDINHVSLARAAQGVYGERAVRNVPEPFMEKYFEKSGGKFTVKSHIRQLVSFERHNLAQDPAPERARGADIIMCRNVTIYFDQETIRRVIARFAETLAPQGFLFIGHAETLWGISNSFHTLEFPHTFIYQLAASGERPLITPPVPILPMPVLGPADFALEEETLPEPEADETPARPRENPAARAPEKNEAEELLVHAGKCADKGDYEGAEKSLKRLIARDQLCVPAYYLLGILYSRTESYEKAAHAFSKVLYLEPGVAAANYHLGNIYRQLRQAEKARREYRNCLKTLKSFKDGDAIPYAGDITAGVLCEAVRRALEGLGGD